jgi:hypothetical protein
LAGPATVAYLVARNGHRRELQHLRIDLAIHLDHVRLAEGRHADRAWSQRRFGEVCARASVVILGRRDLSTSGERAADDHTEGDANRTTRPIHVHVAPDVPVMRTAIAEAEFQTSVTAPIF